MNLNKVFLIGNLTRDPELKTTTSGQPVASFGLATNRFFTDKNGQKQQQVEFHNVVAWGKLAEIASQYLNKGKLAYIEGRLNTRSWEGQDGVKKYRTEIIAERMQLGPRLAASDSSANFQNPAATDAPPKEDEMPVIQQDEEIKEDIPF